MRSLQPISTEGLSLSFCINGNFASERALEELLRSEGLQYGLSLFETIKIHNSTFKDFDEHLHRLRMSAIQLDINLPPDFHEPAGESLKDLLSPFLTDGKSGVLRLQVAKVGEHSQWWASSRPMPYTEEKYMEGFHLGISQVVRHSSGILIQHKTANYGELFLQKKKATLRGLDDLLLLNESGYVTEGTICNLFYLMDDLWFTPPVTDGLLPGIVRASFMNVLKEQNAFGGERSMTVDELLNAKQVYVSNSLFGLMAVRAIEETVFAINPEEHRQYMNQLGF